MSVARIIDRAENLCRRISRLCGAPEISQRRIAAYLKTVRGDITLGKSGNPPRTVAVVIPCFGHAPYLPAALASIVNQARLPDEVIAVNDCSPDATAVILSEFSERIAKQNHVRCTVLTNKKNCGQTFSLNRAISAVNSELVMILNDDDYLMHDAVAVMLDLFRCHGDLALIGGSSIHFRSDGELEKMLKSVPPSAGGRAVELSVRQPSDIHGYRRYNDLNMTHSGCCFRKTAWETVGGYYPDKRKRLVPFSDRDFQLRVNALFPVAVTSDTHFSFWRSNSSVDNGLDT